MNYEKHIFLTYHDILKNAKCMSVHRVSILHTLMIDQCHFIGLMGLLWVPVCVLLTKPKVTGLLGQSEHLQTHSTL